MKGRIWVFLVFFSLIFSVQQTSAQIITRVAGLNNPGNGGPATAAQLLQIKGTGFDSSGSLLFAESLSIRRIDAKTGIISVFAGTGTNVISGDGGPALNASFGSIRNIATDKKGNCYIIDAGYIRKITAATGVITTIAGSATAGYSGDGGPALAAQFTSINSIDVDASGNVYISDIGVSVVRKITAATGIITTIAGTGVAGYTGDGALANTAQLKNPTSLKVDDNNNVFIADNGNYRLRKITATTGIITTIMGDGTSGASPVDGEGGLASLAKLSSVSFLTSDKFNNIYFIAGGAPIRKINATTGIVSTLVGLNSGCTCFSGDGGLANDAGLNNPNSCVLDTAGNIFIADWLNFRIRKVDGITQKINTIAGVGSFSGDGGPAKNAMINSPQRMVTDASGNLYFVDGLNSMLRTIANSTGIISTIAGTGNGSGATPFPTMSVPNSQLPVLAQSSLALDPTAANIYMTLGSNIVKINKSTGQASAFAGPYTGSSTAEGVLATTINLGFNPEIATDATGNVYYVDNTRSCIRKITISNNLVNTVVGNKTKGFSGDGGAALSASIGNVTCLTIDAAGNIYFVDFGTTGSCIRKVATGTNIITTIAGNRTSGFSGDGGQAINAQIGTPVSISTDVDGNVYFVDGSRVRKVTVATGIITTIGGTASYGNDGDGGLATLATLNPAYLTVAKLYSIYISIPYFNAIRRINYYPNVDISIPNNGTLSGFVTCNGIASSVVQSFDVSGSNLLGAINITGNTLHEVSLNPTTGFTTSVSVSPLNGTVPATKIYSRISAIAPAGINTGIIQVSSNSANTRTVDYRDSVAVSPTKPTISTTTSSTFCVGGNVNLTSNSNANYQWYKDGTAITSATSASYIATTTGNYTVATSNTAGCSSWSLPTAVTAIPLPSTPVISPQGNVTSICLNGNNILTSSAPTGNQWFKDGVAINGAINNTFTVVGTAGNVGAYTVVSTVNSCPSLLSTPVSISVDGAIPTTPIITSAGAATAICIGASLTLTSSTTAGIQWYKDGIVIISANGATYSANQAGNFTVTATNGCGNSSSAAFKLTVNQLPVPPTITASSTKSICIGDSIILTSSATQGIGISNGWLNNSVSISGATQKTYSAKIAGAYSATVTDAIGCKSVASNIITVTTFAQPTKPIITWNGSQFVTSATGVSYQWILNSANISGATTSIYKPLDIGNYKLSITDANGCKIESDSFKLVVTAIYTPSTTPNNHKASLLPNPAKTKVVVHFNQPLAIELSMQVLDLTGRVIKEIKSNNENTNISVEGISSGNYFLKVIGKSYDQTLQLIIAH